MVELKKAIRDLAILAIGVLVVDVVFEVTGIALASLNSAVANLSSYVSVSSLASVINTLVPIEYLTSIRESILNGLGVYNRCDYDTARALWRRPNTEYRLNRPCQYLERGKIVLIYATPS